MHDQNVGGCVVHPLHLPSLSVTIRRPFFPSSVWGNNYHMLPFQPPFQFSPSPVPWLFPFLQELGGAGFIPLDTVCIRILPPFPNPACMKIGFEASQNQSSYTWLGGARIIPLDTVCIRILPPFPNPACMKIGFEASQNQSSYTWLGGARIIPLDTVCIVPHTSSLFPFSLCARLQELGAVGFIPLVTERSGGKGEGRVDRWERVALAAAKQSECMGRGERVWVCACMTWEHCCSGVHSAGHGASIHPFDFQLDSTVLSLLSTFSPLSISLSLPSGQSIHRPCIHDFISLNDLTKQVCDRLSPFCSPFCASLPSAPLSLLRLSPFCASLPSAPLSLLRLSPFCASLPSAPLSLLLLSPQAHSALLGVPDLLPLLTILEKITSSFSPHSTPTSSLSFLPVYPAGPFGCFGSTQCFATAGSSWMMDSFKEPRQLLLAASHPLLSTSSLFLLPSPADSAGPFRSAGSAQLASPAGSSQGEGSFEKSPTPFHCIPLLLPLQIQQAPFALLGAPNSPPLLAAVGAMDPSLLQKGGLLIVGPEGGEMRVSFEMPARLFSTRPTVLHHPQPRSTPTLQLLGLRAAAGSRAVHSAGGRNQWVASIGQSNPI
ncbi:unnamed protein product [Closterium sp. NIES-65]|nr:unnamed protein product [Closterium sp. NIES-65]